MVWNVYRYNINSKKIEAFNIFDHGGFKKDVKEAAAKFDYSFDAFKKAVRSSLMYYFWSKSEYEVVVGPWVGGDKKDEMKIDIYDQVVLNWDVFIEYIWDNRKEL